MKYVVVYNAKSGGNYTKAKLRRLCEDAGIIVTMWLPVALLSRRKLAPYLRSGFCIVAVGGDGTIAAAAQYVASTAAVLAPLPGGTLNHFVKDLRGPLAIQAALARLKSGTVRQIDYVTVNGKVVINNAGVGLYPRILRTRQRHMERIGKWPAAFVGSLKVWFEFRSLRLVVADKRIRTPFIFVGNNRYDLLAGSRESLSGGRLHLVTVDATTRWQFMVAFISIAVGRSRRLRTVELAECTVSSPHRSSVLLACDGEVVRANLPLKFAIHPKELRVLV